MSNAQGSSAGLPAVQEFSIRVPKNVRKKYHMMRFNSVLNVDFSKWSQVKMERENNQKEFKGIDDEQPKFGAGSEFGREAKEEARRKKYGIVTKKYRPEDQPWILKVGGKTGKKFKGIREGGVGENAAYYVFTHAADGAIEAYPLCEWYNFQPIARYKALSAEEAEQEFGRRNKAMNYFSLMLRKRLRNCEDGEIEEEEAKGKRTTTKKSKDLKISDMDDWVDSDEESSDEDEEQTEEAKEKKEKKKKKELEAKKNKKKKKKFGSDDSAVEESDDGDEEGRELDYISDSSDSDSDHEAKVDKEMKGVAEESALRKLLASDEEDDEEEEEQEEKKSDNEENPSPEDNATPSTANKKKKKKKKIKKEEGAPTKNNEGESSSDFSPDSSDSEIDSKAKLQLPQLTQPASVGSNGRTESPVPPGADVKRLASPIASSNEPLVKKPRLDTPSATLSFLNIPCFPSSSQQDFFSLSKLKRVLYMKNITSDFWDPPVPKYNGSNESGITEEAVRRYLMRKPMTTTELLQKFKSRKTGLSSDQLVNIMTQILKRINPTKQTIKNKMYLFIKA